MKKRGKDPILAPFVVRNKSKPADNSQNVVVLLLERDKAPSGHRPQIPNSTRR